MQGEAGVVIPNEDYLSNLRKRCDEVGALLVIDEIQTGFWKNGKAYLHTKKYNVVPDLLAIGKAMGGGMPVSGLVGKRELMGMFCQES